MLIIRSQGRKSLGDYEEIRIFGNDIFGYSNKGEEYSTRLGEYKTEDVIRGCMGGRLY